MIKCPYCGKEFDESGPAKSKWYHNDFVVAIALLSLGPFALRLVLANPRYKPVTKLVITILVIIVTVLAVMAMYYLMQQTTRQIYELGL